MRCIYFPRLSLNVQRVNEGIPLMEAEHAVIYLSSLPFSEAIV